MSDPAIKLFGKTIPVPEIPAGSGGAPASCSGDVVDESVEQSRASSTNSSRESHTNKDARERDFDDKDPLEEKPTDDKKEDGAPTQSSEEVTNPDTTSRNCEESVTLSTEREDTALKTSKTEEEQGETSNSQNKNLKKPDKILPCPRCNSMDTKFCYYNNYNVNQPRHFCKNCQRYWTAGGTMRNVPVGAGRRKNKNSASHYRQITVSEAALQNPCSDMPNGAYHPSLNGTVLTFGTDTPLCESMASVLNLADKTVHNYTRNGFHKPEELRIPVPNASGEKGDDQSNKSSVTSTKSTEGASSNGPQDQAMPNCQSFPPQVPYFPGTPWPIPWNPVQWSSPVPPPAFCPPGFTVPFYPATAYWGCAVPGTWNIPWLAQAQPSSPNGATPNSGPNSPTLGKHSREDNTFKPNESGGEDGHRKENNKEKNLWVPKTLRIDDSGEAAKSSIWTTLGIKHDKADSVPGGGLFKAFPSKHDDKNHSMQASPVLQANPAALSRSLNFHETS